MGSAKFEGGGDAGRGMEDDDLTGFAPEVAIDPFEWTGGPEVFPAIADLGIPARERGMGNAGRPVRTGLIGRGWRDIRTTSTERRCSHATAGPDPAGSPSTRRIGRRSDLPAMSKVGQNHNPLPVTGGNEKSRSASLQMWPGKPAPYWFSQVLAVGAPFSVRGRRIGASGGPAPGSANSCCGG